MKRRRSDDDHPTQREAPAHSSPSPASSSGANEGDIADSEGDTHANAHPEAGPSKASSSTGGGEPSSSGAPPPAKKKRTRTLTTPHQAAVLHALLARSRFPTTAMREEVGRAIGLSARKVQVWFQNQRQKARRPGTRTHEGQGARSDLVRHASGPYGVHVPGSVHPPQASGQPVAGPSSLSGSAYGQYLLSSGGTSASAGYYEPSYTGAWASTGQLSGPGMPGSTPPYPPYVSASQGYAHIPPPRLSYSNPDYPPHLPPHGYPSPESWVPSEDRHTPPEPPVYAPHRDLSRNLPPLALDDSRRPSRLPPLEPVPPPRPWSHHDASPDSPAPYRPIGLHSPPRPLSPLGLPSRSSTHPILPRLRIPSLPQAGPSDDRTLAPLTFPPPSSTKGRYSPAGSAHGSYIFARDMHPSPISRRDSPTSFEPRRDYQSSPSRGALAPPLFLRAPQGPPPTDIFPAEDRSSPKTPYDGPSSSPVVSRGRRFDPVRDAISDNESHGDTSPTTTEAHN